MNAVKMVSEGITERFIIISMDLRSAGIDQNVNRLHRIKSEGIYIHRVSILLIGYVPRPRVLY